MLLAGLAFLTFFVGLGRPAITDSDEAFYAQAGREMVESGDWVTPHYNRQAAVRETGAVLLAGRARVSRGGDRRVRRASPLGPGRTRSRAGRLRMRTPLVRRPHRGPRRRHHRHELRGTWRWRGRRCRTLALAWLRHRRYVGRVRSPGGGSPAGGPAPPRVAGRGRRRPRGRVSHQGPRGNRPPRADRGPAGRLAVSRRGTVRGPGGRGRPSHDWPETWACSRWSA